MRPWHLNARFVVGDCVLLGAEIAVVNRQRRHRIVRTGCEDAVMVEAGSR